MNQLESAFAEYFSNWSILLPVDAVATRQPGRIQEKGWVIEYLFGVDGDDEYLDFYASHRMTNDRHERIHANGRIEVLEAPREFLVYPGDADEAARERIKEEHYAHNRAVHERLREKGFRA